MASNGSEVYIKLPTGRNASYSVYPTTRISELCDRVAGEEKVHTNMVMLKYQGKILEKNKTVGQYGVREETILKAEIVQPKTLNLVVVKLLKDVSEEELAISNLDTVEDLYKQVAELTGIAASKLRLKVSRRELYSSSSTLLSVGLVSGTRISVKAVEEFIPVLDRVGPLDNETRQSVLSSFDARGKRVEVAFSFDTTGSMYRFLEEIRRKLQETCTRLIQDIPNIRISLIAEGDYCDSFQGLYAVKYLDLTSDVQQLLDFASNVPKTTGGDPPECYELVLKKAQELDWSEDSAKALVVIGDYYPHPPSYTDQDIYWRDELNVLTGMGVKVYGVHAGLNCEARCFFEEIAEVSRGCYLNLKHLDVITDMFLAVCYNETNEDMLENFQQELLNEGAMTEVKQSMFAQIKEQEDKKKETAKGTAPSAPTTKRSVSSDWWDRTLDKGKLKFIYDATKDKWVPVAAQSWYHLMSEKSSSATPMSPHTVTPVGVNGTSSRRLSTKKGKKKCIVM